MSKPLVSFCLATYNQEKYVEQAMRTIFAQNYSPMEIIICDDCSKDNTVAVLERLIAEYQKSGGQHTVTLVKNEKNLGVAKNLDMCYRMAKGELIVCGAGDDYYKSNRVTRFVEEWEKDGKEANVIHSSFINIDKEGKILGVSKPRTAECDLGAVCAYSRKLFEFFPPFECPLDAEDQVLGKRALLMGHQLLIDEPLTYYRVGSGYSSRLRGEIEGTIQDNTSWLLTCAQSEKDIEFAKGKVPQENIDYVAELMRKTKESAQNVLDLYTGHTLSQRKGGFQRRWNGKSIRQKISRSFVMDSSMLLPRPFCLWVRFCVVKYFAFYDRFPIISALRKFYRRIRKHGEFAET